MSKFDNFQDRVAWSTVQEFESLVRLVQEGKLALEPKMISYVQAVIGKALVVFKD